jgi:hypothetical protein
MQASSHDSLSKIECLYACRRVTTLNHRPDADEADDKRTGDVLAAQLERL